ncbi:MAG TPA: molybdopterin-dependent oxidoreductase [Candidatus Binataceae bacterium]|nr:molybdopterin-dependent oxidoreductase [Candidatus Binataceae bacterium]
MFRRIGTAARIGAAIVFAVIACHGGRAAAQSAPSLAVGGEVHASLALTAADLAVMPRASAAVTDDRGVKATYDGVPVVEILKRAGAPLGKELRGSNMTMCVVAGGSDGYKAVYALAEFDPGFTDQVILVADHRDGKALDSREGPLRIVVPGDKRHAAGSSVW